MAIKYSNDTEYKEIENPFVVSYKDFIFDPLVFIKSITFDPRADDWFVETMKKYCISKGFTCPVEKSLLYKKDFFDKVKLVKKYETVDK